MLGLPGRAVILPLLLGMLSRPAEGQTVCAVLPLETGASRMPLAVADALEVRLAADSRFNLVNRTDLKKIVNEQVLSAAFASEATDSRVRLGKMVKADLVVLLRERKAKEARKDNSAVELIVAETKRGLRLVMTTVSWQPEKVEAIAEMSAREVIRGRDLAGRKDLRVFAVPAFECRDVMPEYAGLRRGLARLAEEFLVQMPGVVAVELSEADALSRELAIGGTTISRDLPFYLIGSYKTSRTGSELTFEFSVAMRRGSEAVGQSSRSGVSERQLAQSLQEVLRDVLPKAVGGASPPSAVKVETGALLGRADVFRSLAEWDEALPLCESALLLDPDNARAHLRLFEGYCFLARSGGKHVATWPPYDPAGRVRYGRIALRHASALVRGGRLSKEFLDQMAYFRAVFGIGEFGWDPNYNGLRQERQRILVSFGDDCLALLGNLQMLSRLDKKIRPMAVRELGRCENWAEENLPSDQSFDRSYRLLGLLDGLDEGIGFLLTMANRTYLGPPGNGPYDRFLDRLGQSPSRRLRQVAHLCRLAHGATDQTSYEKAVDEAGKYVAAEGLDADLVAAVKSFAYDKMMWRQKRAEARDTTSAPTATEDSASVRLTRLSDQWRFLRPDGKPVTQTPWVWSWITCRPGLEVIFMNDGLYRLGENNELTLIAPVGHAALPSSWHGLPPDFCWDGKYFWVPTSRPKEAIAVVDPDRGEVARFDEHEVIQGSQVSAGRLVCIRPGESFFFGCLRKAPDPVRTWAALLKVEDDGRGHAGKRFERIYEARQKTNEKPGGRKEAVDAASPPWWAIAVPAEVESKGPWVMVRTDLAAPLLFDIARKEVRVARASWPMESPVYLNKRFILPDGWVKGWKQKSNLRASDHPDHGAKNLVDWGERPARSTSTAQGFFASAVACQGRLHLLARYDESATPAWISVDPSTWDTRVVLDTFPKDLPRRSFERLCASERYGPIFISSGKAYRLEMPPVEQLPVLKTTIVGKDKSTASR